MRSMRRCMLRARLMWRLSTTRWAQSLKRRIASSMRAISFCWVTYCCWRRTSSTSRATRVGGVAALPHADAPVLELGDLAHRLVEQVAVVGDDEHGAVEVLDELLDDPPAGDVEVGLGLVEQQHVGRLHEARGERHELALAAAERARGAVEVLLGEPEVAQVADGVAAGGVGAEALDEGGLALEHAAHAVEVGDQRGVGQLRLDARRAPPRGRRPRAARRRGPGARCARRRPPSGAGRRRGRRGAA